MIMCHLLSETHKYRYIPKMHTLMFCLFCSIFYLFCYIIFNFLWFIILFIFILHFIFVSLIFFSPNPIPSRINQYLNRNTIELNPWHIYKPRLIWSRPHSGPWVCGFPRRDLLSVHARSGLVRGVWQWPGFFACYRRAGPGASARGEYQRGVGSEGAASRHRQASVRDAKLGATRA